MSDRECQVRRDFNIFREVWVAKSMIRAEQEIFDELVGLCASPGYAHAVAYFCFRDNMIQYSGEMKAEDMRHLF